MKSAALTFGGAIRPTILLALVLGLMAHSAQASTREELQALRGEIAGLRQGQEQLQADLDEIKKLLQQGARAAPGEPGFREQDYELDGAAFLGQEDAAVTLIEFSDYHCPFCRRHATTVLPELKDAYVDTGKVRYVMREYPIANLHPRAAAASEAALCAGELGDYWGMHDLLFANQKPTTDEDFNGFAGDLGLDVDAFTTCMADDRYLPQIRSDQADGQKLGVSGTPSFVVGLTDPENPDKVRLSKFIRGAQAFTAFSTIIDELLEKTTGSD